MWGYVIIKVGKNRRIPPKPAMRENPGMRVTAAAGYGNPRVSIPFKKEEKRVRPA